MQKNKLVSGTFHSPLGRVIADDPEMTMHYLRLINGEDTVVRDGYLDFLKRCCEAMPNIELRTPWGVCKSLQELEEAIARSKDGIR